MESEEEEVKDFFLKKTNQPVSSAKGANPKGHCCREQREGEHPCSDAAEMPQELEQGSHQGYVVLVWVGVAQGSMIHNQGPGEGYEAAGDRDGKERELEEAIGKLNMVREERRRKKEEGDQFLQQVLDQSVTHMEQSTQQRDR